MRLIKDLSGLQFNNLTVIEIIEFRGHRSFYSVECKCGTIKIMRQDTIKITESCGCLRRAADKERLSLYPLRLSHGYSKKIEYQSWVSMKSRCYNRKKKY